LAMGGGLDLGSFYWMDEILVLWVFMLLLLLLC